MVKRTIHQGVVITRLRRKGAPMKWLGIVLACVVILLVGGAFAYSWWTNPRVIRELREDQADR